MLLARTVVFTILVPGFVAVWMPRAVMGRWPAPSMARVGWSGWPLIVIGVMLYLLSAARFYVDGQGTPAIWFTKHVAFLIGKEPVRLVESGLYRRTRNPMYLGVVAAIVGQGLLFGSREVLVYAAVAWVTFHLVVVFVEEPHLRARDPRAFAEFCRQVPRWLPRREK